MPAITRVRLRTSRAWPCWEAKRAPYVGDEEHGARVPPVRDLLFSGLICRPCLL